jgi:HlyD family secretion protein
MDSNASPALAANATPASAHADTAQDVAALLAAPTPVRWWRRPTLWLLVLAVSAGGLGFGFWRSRAQQDSAPVYITEPVKRGDLTLTVTANGTLQPTRSVNIGSELSGVVRRVLVDVNDRVQQGQVLVELDTAKFSDQVARSRAALAQAQAQLVLAQASVKEAQASLARLEEVSRLSGGKVPAATELDTARATLDRAVATESVNRAGLESARAALSTDETNLSRAFIRSPIDGMVLSRSVDPGNAVAASLQAVTLFSIAEDLRRLQLQVNVDEADVGRVAVGQQASFTVSAFATRRFPAHINRVSYGSTITDNVVTYVTRLEVDNADLSLRPGMTATATITAQERKGVLLVPNAALRYKPIDPNRAAKAGGGAGIMGSMMPRMPNGPAKSATKNGPTKQLWVLKDGQPQALEVTPGISDGRMTEIASGDLSEGMAVIVEQRSAAAAAAAKKP